METTSAAPRADWSELLPEIAGDILRRLPSLADRARFRSVCRQWRLAAQQQRHVLPPAFPWLLTSWPHGGSDEAGFISLPDGARHRLPVPADTSLCTCSDTLGASLVFYAYPSEEARARRRYTVADHLLLVDPFSAAAMTLPKSCDVRKLVACSGGLVAAVVEDLGRRDGLAVAFCRPGARSWSPARRGPPGDGNDHPRLRDVALHGGKLYALHGRGELYAYDVGDDDGAGEPKAARRVPCCIICSAAVLHDYDELYLVPSSCANKLFLVVHRSRREFTVLEADLDASVGRWSAATSLDDELLFVSPGRCRALRASHYGGAVRGNCIFFITEKYNCFLAPTHFSYVEGSYADSGVYDMSSKTVRSIFSDEALHDCEPNRSWMFPSLAARP